MSYADYWHCVKCDRKTVYMPDDTQMMNDADVETLCEDCAKTFEIVVVEKQIAKVAE